MSELWLVDFDRTLFKTDAHVHHLLEIGAEHGHILPEQEAALRHQLFNEENTVDLISVFEQHDIDPHALLALEKRSGVTHLYDDALAFMRRSQPLHIVTTATDTVHQRAKLDLINMASQATILDGVEKGEHIRDQMIVTDEGIVFPDFHEQFAFERLTLVDDRVGAVRALIGAAGVRLILLQREDAKYKYRADEVPEGIEIVSSLDDIT